MLSYTEFGQIIQAAGAIAPGMTVGDVPAGGGYLAGHLPAGCVYQGHEPSSGFTDNGEQGSSHSAAPQSGNELLPLPWADGALDVVLSLAGLHHLEDKRPLMAEMLRVTAPGGRLVLSDVATGSDSAKFLDGFVGDYNSTGHEGLFLGDATLEELAETGWVVKHSSQQAFRWTFDNAAAMADFCRQLFDICNTGTAEVGRAIAADLGIDKLAHGIGMRWSLMTIVAEKPA